jgi:tyrosinase
MSIALQTFRLPYWDAAAVPPVGEGSYPACVQREIIEIEVCNGNGSVKTLINNPLYSYRFHPLPKDDFDVNPFSTSGHFDQDVAQTSGTEPRWLQWNSTMRSPTSLDATAKSQDGLVAADLDRSNENLRQRTYQMLSMQHDYHNVSNNRAPGGSGRVADSLESVHDT